MSDREPELVNRAELANGHHAYFVTIEGRHTPGVNSDYFYLNQNTEDVDPKKSRLLALVTDGVSGRKTGTGRYAAQYICENLPPFWETDLSKHPFKFKDQKVPGGKPLAIGGLFEWLINQIEHDVFPIDIIHYVMRKHPDLILREDFPLGNTPGKSASELAKLMFIESNRFQEIMRLLIACYQSLTLGKADFIEKFQKEATSVPGLYAGTTGSGVIETKNDYILFGIGDSPLFIVDEIGPFNDKKTETFESGNRLSALLGWTFDKYNDNKTSSLLAPPGAMMSGSGKMTKNSFISIVYQPKVELFGEYALVGCTDGFGKSKASIDRMGETISTHIRSSRWAIKEIVSNAFQKDAERIKQDPKYAPDDKTMVVIRKSAPDL